MNDNEKNEKTLALNGPEPSPLDAETAKSDGQCRDGEHGAVANRVGKAGALEKSKLEICDLCGHRDVSGDCALDDSEGGAWVDQATAIVKNKCLFFSRNRAGDEIARLREENERLRAGLRKILTQIQNREKNYIRDTPGWVGIHVKKILNEERDRT